MKVDNLPVLFTSESLFSKVFKCHIDIVRIK